jgi:hypothetical protein
MRLEFASSLEDISSLSVTSGEQVLPGPKRKPPRDTLSKYHSRQQPANPEKTVLENETRPSLNRYDASFKREKQDANSLVDLLWKGKWQDVLERLKEHPDEAMQEIQLPDFSMENGGASFIFINALPLHLACAMRPLPPTNMLQALIEAHPEACKQSTGSPLGLLPMHLAADLTDVRYTGDSQQNQREIPSVDSRDDPSTTPQLRKRRSTVSESPNHAEIIKLLLEISPESVLLPEMANEMLPLHIAASTAKYSKSGRSISPVSEHVLELILEAGPPQVATKIRDKSGKTPMDYACGNMQCQACQMTEKKCQPRCKFCMYNITGQTHPLLKSVIKSHLSMITPAIRESACGFIKPATMQRRRSRTHSVSSAHSRHSGQSDLKPRDDSTKEGRSTASARCTNTTLTKEMVQHAAQVLGGKNLQRTNTPTNLTALPLPASPRKEVQVKSGDGRSSATSHGRSRKTPTKLSDQDDAREMMNKHIPPLPTQSVTKLLPPLASEPKIRETKSWSDPQQKMLPAVTKLPEIEQHTAPQSVLNYSNKLYMKAIQSSNIRGKIKPNEPGASPNLSSVKNNATPQIPSGAVNELPKKVCALDPFAARNTPRAFVPVQREVKESVSGFDVSKPMNKECTFSGSKMAMTMQLRKDETLNGILCLQLRLSGLVHPNSTSTSNRSTSPGMMLRRSNSFGNLRKNMLPNPCFEVFLAHRAGLSNGYYKSYPLFNTAKGTWEEAFIDTGLTHRQLEYGIGGGSHVEVGIRVLHCPERGSDMQLIGTCVISLENLERNASANGVIQECSKYPILQEYEVKGWLQVLSFQIK